MFDDYSSDKLKQIIGISYGFVVAFGYSFLKRHSTLGGLDVFAVASGVISLMLLLYKPSAVVSSFKNPSIVLRGLFFSTSQGLLFMNQIIHSTSSTLATAVAGTMVGLALSKLWLKETVTRIALVGLGISVTGIGLLGLSSELGVMGVSAGLLQGLTSVSSRRLMTSGTPIIESIFPGFCLSAVTGLFLTLSLGKSTWNPELIPVVMAVPLVYFIQATFFILHRWFDAHKVGLFSLSRVPAAMAIDSTLYSSIPSSAKIASAILVLIGSWIGNSSIRRSNTTHMTK